MYICFDIGGTRIKSAWVSGTGEHGRIHVVNTPKDLKSFKNTILNLIEKLKNETPYNLKAIGIASAGPLDNENKKYLKPVHLPYLSDFHMGAFLEKEVGLPVIMENDAQAGAVGEYWFGCLKDADEAIFITLGTGVGSGIIRKGKIWRGNHITGPELGHLYMGLGEERECGCGQMGCAETYLGSDGLIRLFTKMGIRISSIHESFEVANYNNKKVEAVMREYGRRLAIFLSMLLVVFGIKVIGISGGLNRFLPLCKEYLWEELKKRFKKRAWWLPDKIEMAKNPELSGLLGIGKIISESLEI